MSDEPIQPNDNKPTPEESSKIWGVSLRGWIALIVIMTICLMSIIKIDIKEPLYTLGGLIVGFYFGANPNKQK